MCARISMSSDDETFDDLPEEELSEEEAPEEELVEEIKEQTENKKKSIIFSLSDNNFTEVLRFLSNINNLDNMTLNVNVWDSSLVKAIEKSILDSNLGVTPQTDGSNLLLKFPAEKCCVYRGEKLV